MGEANYRNPKIEVVVETAAKCSDTSMFLGRIQARRIETNTNTGKNSILGSRDAFKGEMSREEQMRFMFRSGYGGRGRGTR